MKFERLSPFVGAALLVSGVLAPGVIAADRSGTEILFDRTSFDDVRAGTIITYTHDRSADEKIPVKPIDGGAVVVNRTGDGEGEGDGAGKVLVTLEYGEGKGRRTLEHLPADRGNPIFVVFLESSVAAVTYATKGSPFYIRNRIKDAFATGGEVSTGRIEIDGVEAEATHIDYRPLKGDENVDKFGLAFENLMLRFTLSDAVPGRFASMTADAQVDGTVYFSEEMRFETATDGEE